jgi:RES domain-containing protein
MLKAVRSAVPFNEDCFRNVQPKFAIKIEVSSARGSRIVGGRYNFKGTYEVLYLSCDPAHCLEETLKSHRSTKSSVATALPRTVVAFRVSLSRVLDLTDTRQRRRLGISNSVLVGTDWVRYQDVDQREAPTQRIGRLAREAGFEAILVPSAAVPGGKNLNIFPDRVLPSAYPVINEHELP